MNHSVILGFKRSPFTPARKGALARTRPDDLAIAVVRALVAAAGIDPADVEDCRVGCAFPEGEQGGNLGRLVALGAGLPTTVAGATINRFCGSSMQAIHDAAGQIAMGAGELFICAGVESMSRVPVGGFNPLPNPALREAQPGMSDPMGTTAETVAARWHVSRRDQEAFAVRSHRLAAAAQAAGAFADEIVPIPTAAGLVDADGCIRADTDVDALAGLKPAFDRAGTVTAGTSSPLTDGAAAVIVASEVYARRYDLRPLARVAAVAVSGCEPAIMGIGPVAATNKALRRAGIAIADVGVVELNEAFASQALACRHELAIGDAVLNRDGGALAIGHPLGATGARLVGKAASLLRRTGERYALATQCIGGGQGIATILERL